jgi:restriction system protein
LKLKMAENSVFAMLLRSPWWVSIAIAVGLSLLAAALLPVEYRLVGVLSTIPFVVVGAVAARRQWALPGAAQTERTLQAVSAMAWPDFANLLEAAFRRDGYTVQRGASSPVDFELERGGRRMLVSARRWKSARFGVEGLRALQVARDSGDAPDALCICLGELTDSARSFAAEHRVAIWQLPELAQALRGLVPAGRKAGP